MVNSAQTGLFLYEIKKKRQMCKLNEKIVF